MFDRLVCRPIFPESNTIVSKHMNSRCFRKSCNPDCRFVIVREDQEGPAVRDDSAILSHHVHCGSHCMLPYTVMNIPSSPALRVKNTLSLQTAIVATGQLSRSPYLNVQMVRKRLYNTTCSLPGGDTLTIGSKGRKSPVH